MKKIKFIAMSLFLAVWTGRVVNINKNLEPDTRYSMEQIIEEDNFRIEASGACFLTREEFRKKFGLTGDVFEGYELSDEKIVCVCLKVTNTSDEEISYDQIMERTSAGFETRTWGSSVMGEIGRNLNIFDSDTLEPGKTQKIWYGTLVSPACFKKKTWDRLEIGDFTYVCVLDPRKISIQLE